MTLYNIKTTLMKNNIVLISSQYMSVGSMRRCLLLFDKTTAKFYCASINIPRKPLELLIAKIKLGIQKEEDI